MKSIPVTTCLLFIRKNSSVIKFIELAGVHKSESNVILIYLGKLFNINLLRVILLLLQFFFRWKTKKKNH
jgi:hypothetical protein